MTTHETSIQCLATDAILTPAETRIAVGYVDGYIGKEIAERNNISYNTVVRHTQNIYEKTGIRRSTNSLVAWFLSINFSLNISELTRRIGAACLLALISIYTLSSNEQFARTRTSRRTSTSRRASSRRGRNDDDAVDFMDCFEM